MLLSEYAFDLPQERIAQSPADPRDSCRLMAVLPHLDSYRHHLFRELPDLLCPGDCVVINETRVLPARLLGTYGPEGREAEILLLRQLDSELRWEALLRPSRRLPVGASISLKRGSGTPHVSAIVESREQGGRSVVSFAGLAPEDLRQWLWQTGRMPLPPYIKGHGRASHPDDYQTVYSRVEGSVAAPTAGLHFTPSLLRAMVARGIDVVPILLHVGYGTFAPLREDEVAANRMEPEYYTVSRTAAETINRRRHLGGRIIAVGTTVTRTLETLTDAAGLTSAGSGWSDLFIYPGHRFCGVDGLLTNFHLPESSTLLLTAARAGWDLLRRAYAAAVAYEYRFYSFGDAMLVLPPGPVRD